MEKKEILMHYYEKLSVYYLLFISYLKILDIIPMHFSTNSHFSKNVLIISSIIKEEWEMNINNG